MAEQLICNQQVVGSTPTTSSKRGKIPEWPKGADCKSVGTAFGGSNPPLPTKKESIEIPMLSFFVRKRVDSARFSPRGALRLNHLFGADASLMQVNLPVPLLNESTPSKKSRCSFFLRKSVDEEPLQSNRSHRPTATAPLCTLLIIALHNAAFCYIFDNCPTPRLSTSSAN